MQKINFENLPSTKTPINATNLNQMQTNIENEINGGNWTTLELKSNFETYASGYEPMYRKQGKIIEVQGIVKPTTALTNGGDNTVIFNLPTGYRPNRERNFVCQGSLSNKWVLTITSDGNSKISRYGTTSFIEVPVGAWLPFSVTFMVD